MKRNMTHSKIKSIILVLVDPLVTAIGLCGFLIPNRIVNGGVSGLSTIIYYGFSVPPSVSVAVINALLLTLAFKVLGKKFTVMTMIGAGLLSLYIEILSWVPPFTDNVILATIFGAILYGVGVGTTLVSGASTGGSDIIGRLIQSKWQSLPIGKLLLLVDGIIVAVSFLVFNDADLIFFGIISLAIATYTVDYIIRILNISKLAFVITDKGCEIASLLVNTSPRGVTLVDVEGAYTNENKKMLICALKANEITEFQRKVDGLDSSAFVIFSESQQIVGNGFRLYK